NYAASLRLEGFKTTPADGEKSLPSREEVLEAFSKNSRRTK
ncbi:YhfG family protein, partial [Pseudomonas sp. MWU12-2037]